MDLSLLIEAVRLRPEIYDKNHAGFKNPALKDAAWKSISDVIEASSPAECATRWNTLRDRFAKEKRLAESETRSGAAAPTRPEWIHSKSMSFLSAHIRKRNSVDNFPQTSKPIKQPYIPPLMYSITDEDSLTSLSPQNLDTSEADLSAIDSGQETSYTVIAEVPVRHGSSKSSAASLPYLGPTGRSKKGKKDETALMFEQTLQNINKTMSTASAEKVVDDTDSLIGKSVEAALRSLPTTLLKVTYRGKFRELIQKCDEVLLNLDD